MSTRLDRIYFTDGTSLYTNNGIGSRGNEVPKNTNIITSLFPVHIPNKKLFDGKITKTDIDGNIWEFADTETSVTVAINGVSHTVSDNIIQFITYRKNDDTEPNCEVWLEGVVSTTLYRHILGEVFASVYLDGVRIDGESTVGADRVLYSSYPTQLFIDVNTTTLKTTIFFDSITGNYSLYGLISDVLCGGARGSGTLLGSHIDLSYSLKYSKNTVDPYEGGGDSTTSKPNGTFEAVNDPIEVPEAPDINTSNLGLITVYNPTTDDLRSFSSFLWSDLFDISTLKKIFADPMDCILGLSILPVVVHKSSSKENVKLGNITTSVPMYKVTDQFIQFNCGTLDLQEYWTSYLDYDPYTKIEIFLPYIGTHSLKADDVMNSLINVTYTIDILSGACCVNISRKRSDDTAFTVLYSFVGDCACSIPITSIDYSNTLSRAVSIASSLGSRVASGGISTLANVNTLLSTATNIMAMKPNVERSGSFGSTGGLMGVQTPYLIVTRPRQCKPLNLNAIEGYPSYITSKLSSLSGYTVIEEIHLENMTCTSEEVSEIETLLKRGVVL